MDKTEQSRRVFDKQAETYDTAIFGSHARELYPFLWLLSIRAAALYALKPPRPFTPRLQNASGWLLRRSKPGRKEYDYRKLFYHLRRSPLAVPAQ